MNVERLINQRFAELVEKANLVESTCYTGAGGYWIRSEVFHEWATSVLNLLQRVFGENSAHYQNFQTRYQQCHGRLREFQGCKGVFQAAKEDYEGGYLFSVRALVKAEALVDVLEQAELFKDASYIDTACILAGIALEIAIKEIGSRKGVAPGKFNRMNEELRKKGVYNQAMWEQLKTWYTRRNEPAHGNFGYSTPQDADDMLRGIRRFIAENL